LERFVIEFARGTPDPHVVALVKSAAGPVAG
jgi:hypothetical protein